MSIIYVISAIILATIISVTIFGLVGAVEHHKHINLKWVILMITIILSCSLIMVLIYHNQNDIPIGEVKEAYSDSYEDGYNQAIEDAVLIESDEDGYTLSFNGEYHVYTYD